MPQDPVQLLSQADKAYASAGSGFSFFGSRTDKFENAAELYIKAAGAYRLQQAGREAGMAYEKAATIQGTNLGEPGDMANTLQDAFKAYRKSSPEDAVRCLSQAIDHYLSKGEFRRAATQKQLVAEVYKEIGDRPKARSAYEATAQWYEDENSPALASKYNLEAADLAAKDNDYLDAIKRFEHVAKLAVSDRNLRYSVKDYFLRAGVCHLALDIIGAKRAFESYQELDPSFWQTDHCRVLNALAETVEQGDSAAFAEIKKAYVDKGILKETPLDILNRVENGLIAKEEDFS